MANIPSILKTGCLAFAGLAVLAVIGLILLAAFGKKRAPFDQRLAALPPSERSTLDEVLKAAGISMTDLRDVGEAAPLDDARNFRAIAIDDGHVRMLSLQKETKPLPALSPWTALKRLSLRGASLTELPDLSGCVQLESLDASKNQISILKAGLLPSSLQTIDLSENPLADISSLATLKAIREIHIQHAKVTAFDELIDLPLTLLDLRGNPIVKLPEKLPKSSQFKVNLDDCPVSTPPGYLRNLSLTITSSGVAGGRETGQGTVSSGKFQVSGTWEVVPKTSTVSVATSADQTAIGPVNLEVTVGQGRLRVYVTELGESRGPWFQQGFVKGAGGLVSFAATLYADAEPGKPARLRGNLQRMASQPYYFYIEPLEGGPVREMSYRVWRD